MRKLRRGSSAGSGAIDGHRTLHLGAPNLVLADRRFEHSDKVMREQKDFVLLYQDKIAQVWGRRDQYDNPDHARYYRNREC